MSDPDCFHEVLEAPWAGPRVAAVRAGHGVVLLEDAAGRPVLLSTTADVRAFLEARLVRPAAEPPGNAEASGARRDRKTGRGGADLRGVTARVRLARAGSRFEAEWMYVAAARQVMPWEYRAVMDRWRAWFVHVDPGERIPRLRKVDLSGESVVGGTLLGPMRDKEAAGRYVEHLTDIFDLCRDERLLMQAPDATACPYKEMGRCAAPCDGSETLESYRARVAEAARFAAGPVEQEAGRIEARMGQAVSGLRFEEAARLKRMLDRMAPLRGRRGAVFAHVSELAELRWVIVGRSEREEWARVFVCAAGMTDVVADVAAGAREEVLEEVGCAVQQRLMRRDRAANDDFSHEQRDGLALLGRWLNMGEKRRVVRMQRVGAEGLSAREFGSMVRAALRPVKHAPAGEEPPMELEGASD